MSPYLTKLAVEALRYVYSLAAGDPTLSYTVFESDKYLQGQHPNRRSTRGGGE